MRWWRRRRTPVAPAYADDGTLAVVGGSDDPARADSEVVAAMAAAGVDLTAPLLVRHHLLLPDGLAVEEARRLLASDGYTLREDDEADADGSDTPGDEPLRVRASRTQVLTGLAAAQERSRMAGLAQRLGGTTLGWDACAPAGDPAR